MGGPQEYKANMAEMVQWMQAHCPETKIILITPPPVDEVNAPHTPPGCGSQPPVATWGLQLQDGWRWGLLLLLGMQQAHRN